ncbi:MAG: response regulator transcription factor, partial [Bdellovibrionales bacterium]|nr:response regulator transcription factor [Bdellovibrionales bacterium]
PDIILLDLHLPDIDGFKVCEALAGNDATKEIPVVYLTCREDEEAIITGLSNRNVYDFVPKSAGVNILIARLRSILLRRSGQPSSAGALQFEQLSLDPVAFRAWYQGEELLLTLSEFRFLERLLEQRERVFSRRDIISAIHGDDYPVTERSVDTLVKCVRRKLGSGAELIETVRGAGYRLRPLQSHSN